LSFDGIAKGYAVDLVVQKLPPAVSSYLLNFSGNMRWHGQKPDGPWKVAVWNPVKKTIHELPVSNDGAMASSGPENAHFDEKMEWHHIIDPKTLRPPRLYSSVTAVAPTAMEADILSTAFSTKNLAAAQRLRKREFPRVSLWMIDRQGKLTHLDPIQNPASQIKPIQIKQLEIPSIQTQPTM
jgi:thiamine biosynthesis lipoprotein